MVKNFFKIKVVIFLFCLWSISLQAKPRVSIIVSLFEREALITQTMKELTRQTIFKSCEVLLIAPQTSDKVLMGSLSKQYSQLRTFYLPGSSDEVDILNTAIQNSSADFVVIAHAGDLHQKNMLEQRVAVLERDSTIDLVYAEFWWNYEPFKKEVKSCDSMRLPEFSAYFFPTCLPCPGSMWRKSVHQRYGLFTKEFSTKNIWAFWRNAVGSGALFHKLPTPDFIHFIDTAEIVKKNSSLALQEMADEQAIIDRYPLPVFTSGQQKQFVLIVPSYNNQKWYKRNLHSIFMQNYTYYRIIYIDDASSDNTLALVGQYVTQCYQSHRTTIIKNSQRTGKALGNICKALECCDPSEIAVVIDADDWLAHENVLAYLNHIYQDSNVWMTYGQFCLFPHQITGWARQIPDEIIKNNAIREYDWCTTHLRTFYVWLYQKINKESLLFNGEWFPMAGDIAMMMSLAELAGVHGKCIPEILYNYNRSNPINADKVNKDLQMRCEKAVRSGKRYDPLEI